MLLFRRQSAQLVVTHALTAHYQASSENVKTLWQQLSHRLPDTKTALFLRAFGPFSLPPEHRSTSVNAYTFYEHSCPCCLFK